MSRQPRHAQPTRPLRALAVLVIAAVPLLLLQWWPEPEGRAPEPRPSSSETGTGPRIQVSAEAETPGTGTAERPYRSIQRALTAARPGDTVEVGSGEYRETIHTVRSGRPHARIRLVGDDARLRADDDGGRMVNVDHDYVDLVGFDIAEGDIGIYLTGADHVRVTHNRLHDLGGECVRLNQGARHNLVADNRIDSCGRSGFDLDADEKNGEGVYLGTAPEQLDDADLDRTDDNVVRDNHIVTDAAECVDVKEGARRNEVRHNVCSDSRDPEGAGFSSRGIGTVFRGNVAKDNRGSGIRVGGDTDEDGVRTVVRGNRLVGNDEFGLEVNAWPQGRICGNEVDDNGEGAVNTSRVTPTAPCESG